MAAACGAVLLVQIAVIRLAFHATAEHVYLLEHELGLICSFQRQFGIPCPTCGATRGFVLFLQGDLKESFALSPLGPLLAAGILLAGMALLALAVSQVYSRERRAVLAGTLLRKGLIAYGGVTCLIWAGAWIYNVFSLLHHIRA